jgi:hypothetical protein
MNFLGREQLFKRDTMSRYLLGFVVLALLSGPAAAQQFGQSNQPAVSPYLNLLRPGNSPGFNYYGLVRPQMQFQNDIQNLQNQAMTNRAAITDINGLLVPTTGHSTYFLNTSSYFPVRSSIGTGGMRAGGANGNRISQQPGGNLGMPQTGGIQGVQQPSLPQVR